MASNALGAVSTSRCLQRSSSHRTTHTKVAKDTVASDHCDYSNNIFSVAFKESRTVTVKEIRAKVPATIGSNSKAHWTALKATAAKITERGSG
eukprot:scaffold103448_cov17-Prasinocladus_malaysianus.AAC.1